MKTPLNMLHDIVAQISEGNTLLEMIYKNTEEMNEELIADWPVLFALSIKPVKQLTHTSKC